VKISIKRLAFWQLPHAANRKKCKKLRIRRVAHPKKSQLINGLIFFYFLRFYVYAYAYFLIVLLSFVAVHKTFHCHKFAGDHNKCGRGMSMTALIA